MPPADSPRWLKGAIVAIDLANQGAAPTTIAFQYNPETLSRKLDPAASSRNGQGRMKSFGFSGAPVETFTVRTVISAGFDDDNAVGSAGATGILQLLSALEILLYPRSEQVVSNDALLDQGKIEIGGGVYDAPLTLFVWGPNRVLPVVITSVDVREQVFDTNLNPVHAEVDISMKSLSYSDLDRDHKGYNLFLTYQKNKERLAKQGSTGNARGYIGIDPNQEFR